MRRFTPIQDVTPLILASRHTEINIAIQDFTDPQYQLKLFVGKQKIKLEKKDNRTWTPVQPSYVPFFLKGYIGSLKTLCFCMCRDIFPTSEAPEASEMRVMVQRKTGHLSLAKGPQINELINLQGLFTDYWSSDKQQFTVQGQS